MIQLPCSSQSCLGGVKRQYRNTGNLKADIPHITWFPDTDADGRNRDAGKGNKLLLIQSVSGKMLQASATSQATYKRASVLSF